MARDQAQRPQFYEGQYLGAEDLEDTVAYARVEDARHVLGAHTWGIAVGLQIQEQAAPGGGVDAYVTPGYAWDGYGRPIVVLAPYKIPAEQFKAIVFQASIDGGSPEGRLVAVWLRYWEAATRAPRPGFETCRGGDAFSRIQESFRLDFGERPAHADRHDPISVGGYSLDAEEVPQRFEPRKPAVQLGDESIPHQEFPEGGTPSRWLIPLGYVRWSPNPVAGQPGKFVARNDADLAASRRVRRHIGVIAESLYAVDDVVSVRGRLKDFSHDPAQDLLEVEGNVRVNGDVRTLDGKIDFRDANGGDSGVRLTFGRRDDPTVGIHDLEVTIGSAPAATNRFLVGPHPSGQGQNLEAKMAVLGNGNVGIGTSAPASKLEIRDGDVVLKAAQDDAGDLVFQDSQGTQKGRVWSKPSPGPGLLLASTGTDAQLFIHETGKVGVGTTTPRNALAVRGIGDAQELISFETPSGAATWHVNQNFNNKAGLNFVETGVADGRLFLQPGGNVGIGTVEPTATLDVRGRIARMSDEFTKTGIVLNGQPINVPWGTIDDWNVFLSPRSMGTEEAGLEEDNALLKFECYATERLDKHGWTATVRYKYRHANQQGWWSDQPGLASPDEPSASYLLVPK